ncbi:hypothetical protein THAOC_22817, partial [Thalassiosira oceanica]
MGDGKPPDSPTDTASASDDESAHAPSNSPPVAQPDPAGRNPLGARGAPTG